MFSIPLDGSHVNLGIAFFAGFVTFFASCLLPLVPTYLAYLSGLALNNQTSKIDSQQRWQITKAALLFVLGFVATFVILGLALIGIQSFTVGYRDLIERLAGLLFILLGLMMLGVFKLPWFGQEYRLKIHHSFTKHQHIYAILMGVAFGFGWTPCIGPVLAVILFWASQSASTIKGLSLLVVYGLGLGLPFILVALGFEKLMPIIQKSHKLGYYLNLVAGIIIVIVGLLMLLDKFQTVSHLILRTLNISQLAA